MARRKNTTTSTEDTAATVGYEAQLWQMADALRGSMDAAEYKHVVLGLIFLKYISDAFEEQHARLVVEQAQGADPEDPDEYRAFSILWVPPEARWSHLKAQARQPTIGQLVDDAMVGIERDNPALKGVLPKDYARPALDKARLGQLIDMISNIKVGDEASRAKDVLGRVYEYFLSHFASAEGKKGGEFVVLRPRQTEDLSFAALVLHDPKTIEYATNHSAGSTIPYAAWQGSPGAMPIVLPPGRLRFAFDALARRILDRIPPIFFADRTLASLRDALLPKLISGELRVKDAEKFVESAV